MLLVVLGGGLPATVAAQQPPPDVDTYELWLREALIAAQRGDQIGLEDAADRLTSTSRVRLSDGTLQPVDNRWLADALQDSSPDLASIAGTLQAVLDAFDHSDPSAPTTAQARLETLLSQPPFTQPAVAVDMSWLEELLLRFIEWLQQIFSPAVGVWQGVWSVFRVLVIGVSIALLLLVLGLLLRSLSRSVARTARTTANPTEPDEQITAADAMQQSQQLARSGDYRTAMRYLYLALLLRLDEAHLLRYDRTLTNREYLHQLHDNPDLRQRMTPIIQTFDRVWYGNEPLDAASFHAYEQQITAVQPER